MASYKKADPNWKEHTQKPVNTNDTTSVANMNVTQINFYENEETLEEIEENITLPEQPQINNDGEGVFSMETGGYIN